LKNTLAQGISAYHKWHPRLEYLGKVSPTFPAALFSVDSRFARKIERPQKGIK